MDVVTSLPPEIWHHILSLLSIDDIKELALAHRIFYAYGRPFLWHTLNLCSLRKSDRIRTRTILQDPALGLYVQHLLLAPNNNEQLERYSPAPGVEWYIQNPTNVWVCPSVRTWLDVAKRVNWRKPRHSLLHFRISRKTVDVAAELAPLLTNVRKISFHPRFYEDLQPNPHPYCQVLRSICPNRVRCLDLNFCSASAFYLFAEIVRELQITFELLDTLILSIAVFYDVAFPWEFKRDIQTIADIGRPSLQSLSVCWGVGKETPKTEDLFDGLGFFPRLSSFHLTWSRDPDYIAGFLLKHQATLSQIGFKNRLSSLLTFLPRIPRLPHISSVNLVNVAITYPYIAVIKPEFSFCAHSITALSIRNTHRNYHGFSYQDLFDLVSSLCIPEHGSCLRRLRIAVKYLSPEVFDILSNYLTRLQTLDITYWHLVGDIRESSNVSQQGLFWRNMRYRQYSDWRLRCLDASRFVYGNSIRNFPLLRLLSRRIPAVQELGPFDWTDIEIKT
ncbi:hypothetical protein BDN72DRAFT_957552 [Pluteus cervinus]|uniref:Uncharacterized protein n=1 Tax=Pluteus cervinus TaxID=181527 RepID=A0ACD3B2E9_9AGAR|nr:hypothetical protein BDN72DRAFT_957552 [Pluteus cervinus]